jgi:hypothetical protein
VPDIGVEAVFFGKEFIEGPTGSAGMVDRKNIPASAKGPPLTLDKDTMDILIGRPRDKCTMHRADHVARQRVQRLRPRQANEASLASAFEYDFPLAAEIDLHAPLQTFVTEVRKLWHTASMDHI